MSGDFGSIFGMIGSVVGGAIGGPPGAFFGGMIGGMMDGQQPGQAAFSGGMSAIGAGISGGFGGGLGSAGGSGVGGAGETVLGSSFGDLSSSGFSAGSGDLFGAGVNDAFGTNSLFGPSVFDGGMTFGPSFVGSSGAGGGGFSDMGALSFDGSAGGGFYGDIFDPARRLGSRQLAMMGAPAPSSSPAFATESSGFAGSPGPAGAVGPGMPGVSGLPMAGAPYNVFSSGVPSPGMGTGLSGVDLAQLGQVASTMPNTPAPTNTGLWGTIKGGLEDLNAFLKTPAGQGLGKMYNLGTGIYGMVRANQLRAAMDPFASQRAAFAARAAGLMRNPGSLENTPGYQAGLKAVERRLAAQGYTGSGRAMAALAQYGGNQFNNTLEQYARLGGAGVAPGTGDLAQLSLQGQALQRLATGMM